LRSNPLLSPLLGSACLLALLAAAAPAAADPVHLADSTVVDAWTLPGGLRVVTRHIPGATSVVITVCYPTGTDGDPANREGLSSLVGEVAFLSPAGTMPERSRSEMDQIRPNGWMIRVARRFTQLTEIASTGNFPGVLHQVCERMRGVTVTESALRAAIEQVKSELHTNYEARPERSLHYLAGELSNGTSFDGALRFGSGDGLRGLTAREAQELVAERLRPGSAVLCIVGNVRGYDLHKILDHELGALPAAEPSPDLRWGSLNSAQASVARSDIQVPIGVVGVLAPPLSDPAHPGFYRFAVLFGSFCTGRWGTPEPPLTTRFNYSLGDDPEIARYFPPLTGDSGLEEEFRLTLGEFVTGIPDTVGHQRVVSSVDWLLGGPLPRELRQRMQKDPATLNALCSNMAARTLYGNDEFWAEYRRRFATEPVNIELWSAWFLKPEHQVRLAFTPGR
jgi:hypothetical protein